ncbi:hypothetical protein RGQ29_009699 [Quercus rubra]|uniref:Proline-rich protein n=1 Tax=Quercus rubra TaxID=3512 RepID=A0AAN7FZ09_QUERU|nr:hypothetical protein RGQ29_009699 [Quercus rubra]
MVVTAQKLLWVTFVIVLAFPTEGRMLSTDQETNLGHAENGKRVLFERLSFGTLQRGPVPPSGPSPRTPVPPFNPYAPVAKPDRIPAPPPPSPAIGTNP